MKTKTIIILIILIVAGLFIWGYLSKGGTSASVQGVRESNVSDSSLIVSETFYDFGTISMKNGNVIKEFTVTNPTAEAITLEAVFTSCMCTTAFLVGPDGSMKGPFGMPGHGSATRLKETIGPGEEAEIEVVFDPAAHGPEGTGLIKRVVYAETDSEAAPKFQLTFEANVTP